MKLPPLPKMPRARKEGSGPTTRAPKLPKAAMPTEFIEPLPDEVTPADANYEDRKGLSIDATEEGRWFETTVEDGKVGGRCGQCGRLRKAVNLELYRKPFGRGEIWRCKGSCR